MPRKVKLMYVLEFSTSWEEFFSQLLLSRPCPLSEEAPQLGNTSKLISQIQNWVGTSFKKHLTCYPCAVQLHLLWHDFLSPSPAASDGLHSGEKAQWTVDGHWTAASPPVTTSVKVTVGLNGVHAHLLQAHLWNGHHQSISVAKWQIWSWNPVH